MKNEKVIELMKNFDCIMFGGSSKVFQCGKDVPTEKLESMSEEITEEIRHWKRQNSKEMSNLGKKSKDIKST